MIETIRVTATGQAEVVAADDVVTLLQDLWSLEVVEVEEVPC